MASPNIIFIVLDTLRADKVFSYYRNKNLTPTLMKLLDNSLFFENCITNSPWTLPSHIAMFTGLYPTQHELISEDPKRLSPKIPILTEILKKIGYNTFCYTENPWISKNFGLTRGFDKVFKNWKFSFMFRDHFKLIDSLNEKLKKYNSKINKRIKSKILLNLWYRFKCISEICLEKLKKKLYWRNLISKYFIDTISDLDTFKYNIQGFNKSKPVYMFFNIMATHYPYCPTKKALKYRGLKFRAFKKVKKFYLNPKDFTINLYEDRKSLSKKKIKTIIKLYEACVYYSDQIVEKIISNLKELDLYENSYIIITSDHGEHLFSKLDHNLWGHGNFQSVYEPICKVPLFIYNKSFKKKIIQNQVELKDLFHTILQIANNSDNTEGQFDLNKSILYQNDMNSMPEYIFGEHLKSTEEKKAIIKQNAIHIKRKQIPRIFKNIYFLRSNSYKYIKFDNQIEEFYDLLNDPHEQINIFDIFNEECKSMKQTMVNQLKKIRDLENIKHILIQKEKETIKKIIGELKTNNI